MIYATLSVFQMYSAFITADSKENLIKYFAEVVVDAVEQYENFFHCSIGTKKKMKIHEDMKSLIMNVPDDLESVFYDMTIDGDHLRGCIEINEVYTTKKAVLDKYQVHVDELNEGIEEPDEQWSVFGGFFPEKPGYEIDELFK